MEDPEGRQKKKTFEWREADVQWDFPSDAASSRKPSLPPSPQGALLSCQGRQRGKEKKRDQKEGTNRGRPFESVGSRFSPATSARLLCTGQTRPSFSLPGMGKTALHSTLPRPLHPCGPAPRSLDWSGSLWRADSLAGCRAVGGSTVTWRGSGSGLRWGATKVIQDLWEGGRRGQTRQAGPTGLHAVTG